LKLNIPSRALFESTTQGYRMLGLMYRKISSTKPL